MLLNKYYKVARNLGFEYMLVDLILQAFSNILEKKITRSRSAPLNKYYEVARNLGFKYMLEDLIFEHFPTFKKPFGSPLFVSWSLSVL